MDFSKIMTLLKDANLFDLYRLQVAIDNELKNPSRLVKAKQKLRLGMSVTFFCDRENRLIPVTILELKQQHVIIRNEEDHQHYRLPYYMLNIDQTNASITPSQPTQLNINTLKVGDRVGFTKDGVDFVGVIKRLNQKTVTLDTKDGHTWRVAYVYLFRVTDGDLNESKMNYIVEDPVIDS